MDDQDTEQESDRWAPSDRWQVVIGALGLLVAIVACVGQFAR
ncbi:MULTISPECIES: hypothetical protein [Streptomyces]|jgi:hypothetical protein|uniref:Uncharacterized protein n=1 Tax=Streptomyces lydicamycinicus TaxID=1546107 RepID=A0A0P4R6T4_9ACTN|nr:MULTISPECIES: hypothetical protein [Streptomyces]GAO08626.1 hypothetical protein TPA0598_04_02620 [Streptomyces lydicamycinicus]